jgi:hypothetical protein
MQEAHNYSGPERRRFRTYVTRNTEYHFNGTVCVAVRDRRTGRWLPSHLALNRKLSGGVKFLPNGAALPSSPAPRVGEALYFAEDGRELVTSLLCDIERPQKEVVRSYP